MWPAEGLLYAAVDVISRQAGFALFLASSSRQQLLDRRTQSSLGVDGGFSLHMQFCFLGSHAFCPTLPGKTRLNEVLAGTYSTSSLVASFFLQQYHILRIAGSPRERM